MTIFRAVGGLAAGAMLMAYNAPRDSSRASSASLDDKPVASASGVTTTPEALNTEPSTPGLHDVVGDSPRPGVAAFEPEMVSIKQPASSAPIYTDGPTPLTEAEFSDLQKWLRAGKPLQEWVDKHPDPAIKQPTEVGGVKQVPKAKSAPVNYGNYSACGPGGCGPVRGLFRGLGRRR